jgi:hypothetical protein
MRRKLNREETYTALYWFYIDGKDLGTISRDLQCSIYDLSPWITEVATRIILGLPERNPDLQAVAKLLADMDHVSGVTAQVNPDSGIANLLDRAAKTIRSLAIDHEIDQNFLHISDIRYRQAIDIIADVVKCSFPAELKDADSSEALALVEAVVRAQHFLEDDTPTNTTDDTYTEGVAADGAAILKDGIPLTITQILDILNGRTRR